MTIDIDRLRSLAEAATPGPWTRAGLTQAIARRPETTSIWSGGKYSQRIAQHVSMPNGFYIAAAHPQAVLALLDRVDRQSALCAAMATHLDNLQHWTTLPDDAVILESRSTDGRGELKITAGMIRRANG